MADARSSAIESKSSPKAKRKSSSTALLPPVLTIKLAQNRAPANISQMLTWDSFGDDDSHWAAIARVDADDAMNMENHGKHHVCSKTRR